MLLLETILLRLCGQTGVVLVDQRRRVLDHPTVLVQTLDEIQSLDRQRVDRAILLHLSPSTTLRARRPGVLLAVLHDVLPILLYALPR